MGKGSCGRVRQWGFCAQKSCGRVRQWEFCGQRELWTSKAMGVLWAKELCRTSKAMGVLWAKGAVDE